MFPSFPSRSPRIAWLLAVAALVALDQATKAYFAAAIPLGGVVVVTDWFNFVHTLNEGAAFSLFASGGGWQRPFLIVVSLVVIVPITWVSLSRGATTHDRWPGALIVAGGTGNLIDRVDTGAVVDFLDLHWRGLHWPAFNFADIYIVSALLVWLVVSWRMESRRKPAAPQQGYEP